MYQFFKRNSKRLMAVFAVLLMVSFALTSTGGRPSDPTRIGIGTLDGHAVTTSDVGPYQSAWQMLKMLVVNNPQAAMQRGQDPGDPFVPVAAALGLETPEIEEMLNEHPEAFFLLCREAESRGLFANVAAADAELDQLRVRDPRTGSVTDLRVVPATTRTQFAWALAHGQIVRDSFLRGAIGVLKVPQSASRVWLATRMQEGKFRLAELPLPAVPTPTDEAAIRAHFEKYADVSPGRGTPDNVAGSGYRLGAGVKAQYAVVPFDETRRVVRAGRSEFDWDLAARQYYEANPAAFRTAASQPATRPFAQVREAALDAVLRPATEERVRAIAARLASRMGLDYTAYRTAADAKQTPPASSLCVAYDDPQYLEKAAAALAAEFGVLPRVTTLASDFRSAEELGRDPVLGRSFSSGRDAAVAAGVLGGVATRAPGVAGLATLEPTPTFSTDAGDAVIARVLATRAAGKPAAMTEAIREKVVNDLRLVVAVDAAKKAAEPMLSAEAALPGDPKPSDFVPIGAPPPSVQLGAGSIEAWRAMTAKLLAVAGERKGIQPPPRAIFVMPALPRGLTSGNAWLTLKSWFVGHTPPRVFVVELTDLRGLWTQGRERELYTAAAGSVVNELAFGEGESLQTAWFNYDAIVKRTGFERTRR
jgi:hypothetical protein